MDEFGGSVGDFQTIDQFPTVKHGYSHQKNDYYPIVQ